MCNIYIAYKKRLQNTSKEYKSIKVNTIINYFDYFLFTIVIFTFLADIIDLLSYINNSLIEFFNINGLDLIHNMSENKSISNTNTTTKNGPKFEVHQSSYTKVQEAQFNSYLKMNKPKF